MIDYALTTKERVKARIELDNTSMDDVIETMIASATAFIENILGRRLAETERVELYDGSDLGPNAQPKPALILRGAPVSEITSIEYRQGLMASPVWTAYSVEDYVPDLSAGIVAISLPGGTQNVRVTYTAGYKIDFNDPYNAEQHTLPFELTNLCEKLVLKMFKRRNSEGKSQETLKDSTIAWGPFLDPEDQAILANFKRVAIF